MDKFTAPQFLPWLRAGLASSISDRAVDGMAPGDTTSISVAVTLRAGGVKDFNEAVPSPAIRLRGPGEVVGIDPALIVRHDPEPGTADAESTYLSLVEFSEPDFPWRYTPAAASGGRLQPWIVLVVVEEREGVWLENTLTGRLPVLHVDEAVRELPELQQSWAWAHVQADHDLASGTAAALAESPDAFRARLLCPRRLIPDRSWIACLVPAFQAGKQAGLGEAATANAGLAWDDTTVGEVRLPVYHSWRFKTGPKGDFESLVRRLTARSLPPSVGRRDLDISQPGGGLPEIKNMVISYQGALVSIAGRPRPWPDQPRHRFKSALREILNAELVNTPLHEPYDALRDDPVVGPPVYAVKQAQRSSVPAEGAPPPWFGELNTEPQNRSVAGLGAAVIRRDQETLMAKAWEYAASTVEAGRILNRARAAWEAAKRLRPRFDTFPDEVFIQIVSPAMARLPYSPQKTMLGAVVDSALPGGLLSGAFRRLTQTVPGFAQKTPGGRTGMMAAVTRKALDHPVDFVAYWATMQSPENADVEEFPQQVRVASASRVKKSPVEITPRVQVTGIPYTGNELPVLSLAAKSRNALDPTATIQSMVNARITGLLVERDQEAPGRLYARPVFTTPMYRRLVALSVEYLVPGIGEIPDDTLGLLETNPPYIEAFLAGLNDAMGREFLWREYPARADDTWFRTFWNSTKQTGADIVPIRQWQEVSKLGENAPPDAPRASLVLLIRSVLLRRYPDLRVYAVEAAWEKEESAHYYRREAVEGDVKTPLFAAQLTTDITVFGFDLQEEQARGSTSPEEHPGYFFVLEQQPSAPRFGLDARLPKRAQDAQSLNAWVNLSWSHLVEDGAAPAFIDVNRPDWLKSAGPLPSNSDDKGAKGKDAWGEDAAAMARITFQRPVRMLVHADAMLPPGSAAAPKDLK